MPCAVYFRLARDKDRAYREAVRNELLRAFGYRIPMCVSPIVTEAIRYADKSVDPQRRETPQQAAERIKRELFMNDLFQRSLQTIRLSAFCGSGAVTSAK